MQILFLISRFLDGGIDTVLVEYINAMCGIEGYDVTLAIATKMNDSEVFLPRLSPKVRIEYLVDEDWLTAYKRSKHHHRKNILHGVVDELLLNPVRRLLMHRRLRTISRDKDVVIDFDACFGSFMSDVPQTARRLVWFHFSIAREAERVPKRIRRLKKQFSAYNRIVLISDDMVAEAKRLLPEYTDKYCRLYNCLDRSLIEQRAAEPVDDPRITKPFFLAVERLEESQKDLTTLIKAHAMLPDDAPLLYIIGEGKSRPQLEALISSLGIDNRVVLLGFIANPYPWLRRAVALVHSSKFEGLPTVLIEALLMDKLIVSSDCPTGPREILADGNAGLLTPVGDAEALSCAMHRIITDHDLADRLRHNVRRQQQLFMPQTVMQQLHELIVELS